MGLDHVLTTLGLLLLCIKRALLLLKVLFAVLKRKQQGLLDFLVFIELLGSKEKFSFEHLFVFQEIVLFFIVILAISIPKFIFVFRL